MDTVASILGGQGFGIGLVVVALFMTIALAALTWAARYHRAGPDEVLVISGRRYAGKGLADGGSGAPAVGHRIVRSGGAFVMPVLEQFEKMSLHVIATAVKTANAISKEGVPLTVEGTALFKIASTDSGIIAAAERYLGRPAIDIENDVRSVLEGHLRGVCGQLTPEEIYRDRQAFQKQIAEQAQDELSRMGISLDTFTLRDINDANGYLHALGERRTAEVKRDARVGTAEAEREAVIKEAEATQLSETAKAQAQTRVSEAARDRDVLRAQYDAQTQAEQAKVEQVARQSAVIAEQAVIDAQTDLAIRDGRRRREELEATQVAESESAAKVAVIEAQARAEVKVKDVEGQAKAQEINAAASARVIEVQAQADANARTIQARAESEAVSVQADGEAAATLKKAQADAAAIKAMGEAEAAATYAKLQAEAKGLTERAEALKTFTDEAIRIELSTSLIERLPEIVAAAASPLASVDRITITDFGGEGGAANGLLGLTPQTLARTEQMLKDTLGMGLNEMIGLVRNGTKPQ